MQKVGRIGILFFLILMFLFQLPSQAQSKKNFAITGKIVPESGESGVGVIEITKNGKEISKIDIPKNGKFKFELEFFNEYSLNFKYTGHFNKIINVSTDIPEEVWKRDNDFPPFPMVVQLLKEFEGIDKSFTLKPSGRIFYGKDIDNFKSESYISDIQFIEQIETAKAQANKVQKEAQSISKENAQDLAVKQKDFDLLIKEADAHYKRGEYQMALTKYMEAKKLFPEKAYPTDRVAELRDLVKALEITEKQKAELDQKYKDAIAKANGFFDQKNYRDARPVYEKAVQYKPGDVFADGRINEIDQLLALLEKQKKYNDLITQADNNYKSKKYDQAIALYNQAKQVVPEEQYPQNQLNLINQEKLQQTNLEQLEKDFNQAIQTAGSHIKQKDFLQALNSYKKALELKPDSKLAQDKIAETERLMAAGETDKQNLQVYQNAIQRADKQFSNKEYNSAQQIYKEALLAKPDEKYPANQLVLIEKLLNESYEQNYKTAIAKADNSLNSNLFDEATSSYNEALNYKKDDEYALRQLKETSRKKAAYEAELNRLRKIQEQYDATIAEAGNDFRNMAYQQSKEKYGKALTLKPEEAFPKEQIARIDQILKKLKNEEEINRQYAEFIRIAQDEFQANKLIEARNSYQKAASVKPKEPMPPMRIAEIDALLAQLAETAKLAAQEEARRMAKEKADRIMYDKAIAAGDKSFTVKQYQVARAHYTTALTILPTEKYPTDQIAKIDNLLSKAEMDKMLALQKTQQDSLQKIKDMAFDLAMKTAKEHEQNKRYQQAIQKYEEAIQINASQESIIQKLIRDIEDKMLLLAKQEAEYNQSIKLADEYFAQSKLNEALIEYRNAVILKTNEDYPKNQITEIQEILSAREAGYAKAIKNGDKAYDASDWSNAKTAYTEASDIKPDESYPKNQIALIDKLLNEAQVVETNSNKLPEPETTIPVSKPVFNPDESAQATEVRARSFKTTTGYDEALKKADELFGIKDYTVARFYYYKSSEIKPEEEYPKDQIEIIRKLIDSQLSENDRTGYDQAIVQADEAFAGNTYTIAKFFYYKALDIKSWEKYPKDRINEILALTNSLLSEKEEKEYRDFIEKADEAYFNKDIAIARFYYNKAIPIKKDENYPWIKLKDIQKLLEQDALDQANQEYQKLIEEGDQALKLEDFSMARFNYNKALTLKPDDKYSKDQLKLIKETLDKQKN